MQGLGLFLRLSFSLFALLITVDAHGQKILVFDRDGHDRRIRFHVHDEIAICTSDNSNWEWGEITDIGDSTINIADNVIVVSNITAIRYDSRIGSVHLLHEVSKKFPAAAVSLLAIYAINAVINHSYPVYSTHELLIAGSLIAAAPIAYFFTYHQYRINKHHRIKVIDVAIQ